MAPLVLCRQQIGIFGRAERYIVVQWLLANDYAASVDTGLTYRSLKGLGVLQGLYYQGVGRLLLLLEFRNLFVCRCQGSARTIRYHLGYPVDL